MILRLFVASFVFGISQVFIATLQMDPGVIILFLLIFTVSAFLEPFWGVLGMVVMTLLSFTGIYSTLGQTISIQAATILIWFSLVMYFFTVTD